MASTSSTSRAARLAAARLAAASLAFALLAVASSGCEQSDDVVAKLSALGDGGGPLGGSVAPTPVAMPMPTSPSDAGAPRCETSEIYVLLSSILRHQCHVPSSGATLTALAGFFVQNQPTSEPGEARPVSLCDLFGGRFTFVYEDTPGTGDLILCPANCDVAKQYVAAEDQRVLECQGLGGG